MAICLECCCGQEYRVPEKKAGRLATCPGCCSRLIVPIPEPDEGIETVNLPPRRRKRKRSPDKPELKKQIPPDHPPGFLKSKEMHPLIVSLLALLMFVNGWNALQELIYVPLFAWVHSSIEEALDDITDEELSEMQTTREEINQRRSDTYRMLFSWIVGALAQLGLAASLAGIITWRGYAVYFAVGFAVLLYLMRGVLYPEPGSSAGFHLMGVVTVIVLLKYMPPVAWPRLMGGTT